MLGQTTRATLRSTVRRNLSHASSRRHISFAPPAQKSRTWKGSAARWGLAIGAIYYYNTSPIFAEEPAYATRRTIPTTNVEDEQLPTVDSVAAARKQKRDAAIPTLDATSPSTSPQASTAASAAVLNGAQSEEADGPQELEEEAGEQGAFNEETGEINWDCPCLGGMAHGPCGEEFREAFSCFVFSKEDPKGVDCIERFKAMQDCFRAHPDIYGAELSDDVDEEGNPLDMDGGSAQAPLATSASPSESSDPPQSSTSAPSQPSQASPPMNETKAAVTSGDDDLVPRAAHDATSKNKEAEK